MRLNVTLARAARGCLALALGVSGAAAQTPPQQTPPPNENVLGEFVVTGTQAEHFPKIAILPSLSPDLDDVIVRSVVRRDFELTGMFDVIPDSKAPAGLYGFDDAVDVAAWRNLGAEAIIKVAAQADPSGKVQIFGLAYFLNVGATPVYQRKVLVEKSAVRVTAHRVTDALLGALTGRPGGFASHFAFAGRWGVGQRIFTMDSDGHALKPVTPAADTAMAATWGPKQSLFYAVSQNYAPFKLIKLDEALGKATTVTLPFKTSVYSVAFNHDQTKMALAVAENDGSSIYVGRADGTGLQKVSKTLISINPVFSPSGKLAWIGGQSEKGTQRVWVDGKVASPAGFTAASPTFCDTEDGVRLLYSVAVGGDRQDLVISNETGGGIARLTQNQGSNTSPACSPDGRMLAFFSTRGGSKAIHVMSLKRWRTQKLATQSGTGLRWAALPPAPNP